VVEDNVQETINAPTEPPLPRDEVDNNKNQDQQKDPKAQPIDDTVQQISNATTEDPERTNLRTDNNLGTEWMKSPI
jgi:hypothetical protein